DFGMPNAECGMKSKNRPMRFDVFEFRNPNSKIRNQIDFGMPNADFGMKSNTKSQSKRSVFEFRNPISKIRNQNECGMKRKK
ncbi:MAG: hypothetical protein ONB27_15090, partial [candidate division KSB1 bacterium]|nr:hypothetical protein [candidate division KSB1 bacterium]